jgi:hypothetical protein
LWYLSKKLGATGATGATGSTGSSGKFHFYEINMSRPLAVTLIKKLGASGATGASGGSGSTGATGGPATGATGATGAQAGAVVVLGGSGTNALAFSYDGIVYYGVGTSIATSCEGVAYSAEMQIWVVACSTGTNKMAWSLDGIHWTGSATGNSVLAGGAFCVAWSSTQLRFVAGGKYFQIRNMKKKKLELLIILIKGLRGQGELHTRQMVRLGL